MKIKVHMLSITIFVIIGLLLPVTTAAQDIYNMGPDSHIHKIYELDKGDIIEWDWVVVGEGYIDFWIEDEDGVRYKELYSEDMDKGSFEVPKSGSWIMVIENNGQNALNLEIEEDIDFASSPAFLLILLVLIIIIVILLMALSIKKKQMQPPEKE